MEFNSLTELYQAILPAFDVKKRLLSVTKYKNTTNELIWNYLSLNKWKYMIDLTLAEIVNDIINIDIEKIYLNGGSVQ